MRDLRRDPFGRCQLSDPGVCCIAAAIGLGAASISAIGSSSAAHTQADAANNAAATQLQMYNQTRSDLAPFRSGGGSAFSQLANIFGFGGGTGTGAATTPTTAGGIPGQNGPIGQAVSGLMFPGGAGAATGTAAAAGGATTGAGGPNPAAAWQALTQFPGYQFGLDQGQQALDRSAASRGMTLSGAQLQDSQKFGTDYAAQQAWQPYVNTLEWASNLGENAAAQTGQAAATAGQGIASSQLAAGQATAAGQVGTTNAITGLLGQAQQSNYWGMGPIQNTPGYNPGATYGSTDLTGLY